MPGVGTPNARGVSARRSRRALLPIGEQRCRETYPAECTCSGHNVLVRFGVAGNLRATQVGRPYVLVLVVYKTADQGFGRRNVDVATTLRSRGVMGRPTLLGRV